MLSGGASRGASYLTKKYMQQAAQGAARGGAGAAGAAGAGAAGAEGAAGAGAAGLAGGGALLAGAAALAAVAAVAGVVAVGLNQRYGMIGRGAAMERQVELAGRTGGASIGINSRAMREATGTYGYSTEEAGGTLSSYYSQIGVRGSANFAMSPFAAMLEGISSSSLAAYQKGPTLGTVAENAATLPQALGLAKQLGLSGSQVDDLLGRIASASESMLSQGLTLDRASTISLAASLGAASPRSFGGSLGTEAATRLAGMGAGAAQGLTGQFGGLIDVAIQADAFSKSTSLAEAAGRMQRMSGADVRAAALNGIGPEATTLGFMGKNFSEQQARVLAGDLSDVAVSDSYGAGRAGALSRAQAAADRSLLATGLASEETSIALIEGVAGLQQASMAFSAKFDVFSVGVLDALARFGR